MNLYIVNEIDRPCERLVAEKRADGKLYYIHPDLRDLKIHHGMLLLADAVPLENFGFDYWVEDGVLHAEQVRESIATYTNGRTRRWQGAASFIIQLR